MGKPPQNSISPISKKNKKNAGQPLFIHLLRSACRRLDDLAARKWLVIVLSGCVPILLNPLFSLFMGIPAPQGTDEFGYLLMGDTFVHGRIANPPPTHWEHFQTFAEIHHPTRTAISPPMQGAFLALGQKLFGLPIAGVWISIGLMCAAISWMLYGWLRPAWALLGTILAFFNLGCYTYWSHTYWGGAPAALGGSLIFGALPRLLARPNPGMAILLGSGCAICANSRPLEGFIVGLPVAGVLIVWLFRNTFSLKEKLLKACLPLLVVMSFLAGQIAFFNKAATGDMFIFPEMLAIEKLSSIPLFLWQKMRPEPHFEHAVFKKCEYEFTRFYYTQKRSTLGGFLTWSRGEMAGFVNFYLGMLPLFAILSILPHYFRHRKYLFVFLVTAGLFCIDTMCLSIMSQPNYFAPVSCLIFLLVAIAFRRLYAVRFGRKKIGRYLVPFLVMVTLMLSASNIFVNRKRPAFRPLKPDTTYSRGKARSDIIDSLKGMGGCHLIFVRYGPRHEFAEEWVYNGADIDGSPVVFARELDAGSNKNLARYFSDRKIWQLRVYDDGERPELSPLYPAVFQ